MFLVVHILKHTYINVRWEVTSTSSCKYGFIMVSYTYSSTFSAVSSCSSCWHKSMSLHCSSNCCSWSLHCFCCSSCILPQLCCHSTQPGTQLFHHINALGTYLTRRSGMPQIFSGEDVKTVHLGREWPVAPQWYWHLAGCSCRGQLWCLNWSLWLLNWRTGNHMYSLLAWGATCHWY